MNGIHAVVRCLVLLDQMLGIVCLIPILPKKSVQNRETLRVGTRLETLEFLIPPQSE